MGAIVGIDAHKKEHTMCVVDAVGRKLAEKSVPATSAGHKQAMKFVRSRFGTDVVWGVEDCRPLTSLLERELLGAGQQVVRVPPHLMARARASSRAPGKSDPIDALAVARAILREPDLPVAFHDQASMELKMLVDRRDDLVGQRIATINRLVARVHELDPLQSTPVNWRVKKSLDALGMWLATQHGLMAELACDEFGDTKRLGDDVDALSKRIGARVGAIAPTLLALPGCAELTAAKIVAEAARIERFKSDAAFARYVGLAPIPHWSGPTQVAVRPTRRGNRQLSTAIHRIAITQIRLDCAGRQYFQRRLDQGDSRPRALRALKRHLSRVVFRSLYCDRGLRPQAWPFAVVEREPVHDLSR